MATGIATLHQARNGTVSDPPPMATSAEMPPIPMPAPLNPAVPGNWRVGFGLRSRNNCSAMKDIKTEKKIARGFAATWLARNVAAKVPNKIPGVMRATTGQSTALC